MMAAIAASLSEKNKYPTEPFPMTEEQVREQKEREFRRKAEQFRANLVVEEELFGRHGVEVNK